MIQKVLKAAFLVGAVAFSFLAYARVEVLRAGGPVMVPLLLLSWAAFAIIFSKLIQFSQLRFSAENLLKSIFELLDRQRIKEAIDLCDRQEGPLARILKAGIVKYDRPKDEIRESMEDALLFEMPSLEAYLPVLSTVLQVAPLLGFVGTIVGLMQLFVIIQAKGASLLSVTLADVAPGIWQALICPAAGFLVAIPALVAYNYLGANLKEFVTDAEHASTELLNFLLERRMTP